MDAEQLGTALNTPLQFDDSVLDEFLHPEELAEVRARAARRVVGVRLGEVRERLALTQKQVAERMGVTRREIRAIEEATERDLKVSTLVAYAEALSGHVDGSLEVADLHLDIA